MLIAPYEEHPVWEAAEVDSWEQPEEVALWKQVSCWLALIPTWFITVSGRIQTDTTPVAFRFTAMEEDSFSRRLARLACSALIIALVSTRMREILACCKRSKLLLSLPAIAFLSVLWSQNPQHTVVDALNLLLTTLFAVYIYVKYPGEKLVSYLSFAAFISLCLCLITVIAFPSIGIDAEQADAWRGIFGQRNNCAAACTLFMVVGLHWQAWGLSQRLMRGAVIFLSLAFIVMSGSRTGWIVAAIALALVYGVRFTSRIRSLDRMLFLLVIAVPIVCVGISIGNHFGDILAVLDKDPTLTQRTIIWAQVLPSIAKHPYLGYGYSSFWAGLNGESIQTVLTTGWMEGQAQDGYLDVLLQVGLLGFIPLVILFVRAFVQAAKAVERHLVTSSIFLAIALLPLILVENIGESSLLLPLGIPWFYTLIGFLILDFDTVQPEVS